MAARVTGAQLRAALASPITKSGIEQRFSFGVAYPANRLDGHGEFMSADQLEKAAWGFLAEGREIGIYHADGTVGHGIVVESSIYRGPAYLVKDISGGEQRINPGDWLLGVVWDTDTWPVIKTRTNGWSIQGFGKRRTVPRTAVEANA